MLLYGYRAKTSPLLPFRVRAVHVLRNAASQLYDHAVTITLHHCSLSLFAFLLSIYLRSTKKNFLLDPSCLLFFAARAFLLFPSVFGQLQL